MLVLLDRDGVINQDAKPGILQLSEFKFLPRVKEAIAMLTKAGFKIAVCTNQSAVGRGNLSLDTLATIHAYLHREIENAGGRIDKIYFAPDLPEAPTERRKPGPGMLHEALAEFRADAARTPMVGDMLRDLEAATAAGCPRILVRNGKGAKLAEEGIPAHVEPVTIVADLYEAAIHICETYR